MSTEALSLDERIRGLDAGERLFRTGVRWNVRWLGVSAGPEAFAHSVARGLSDHPRWLHCRYLYDEEGSRIFSAPRPLRCWCAPMDVW